MIRDTSEELELSILSTPSSELTMREVSNKASNLIKEFGKKEVYNIIITVLSTINLENAIYNKKETLNICRARNKVFG